MIFAATWLIWERHGKDGMATGWTAERQAVAVRISGNLNPLIIHHQEARESQRLQPSCSAA